MPPRSLNTVCHDVAAANGVHRQHFHVAVADGELLPNLHLVLEPLADAERHAHLPARGARRVLSRAQAEAPTSDVAESERPKPGS